MARILFIDDEPWFLEPVGTRLEQEGHSVQYIRNGQDALDSLRSAAADVVVLDIMMPYSRPEGLLRKKKEEVRRAVQESLRGGIRIYRELVDQGLSQRLIIFSVLAEDEIRDLARDVAFQCVFLRKGVEEDEDGLLPTIRQALKA